MSQVKLPYCRVVVNVHESPFGVQEVEYPNLYSQPVAHKVIVKVDILDKLRDRLDEGCFICRDLLYALFSGSNDEQHNYQEILYSYYRKFPSFRNMINDLYYYGDDTVPMVKRIMEPLRKELDEYRQEISNYLSNQGGKFLVSSHDFIYYAFAEGVTLPEVQGAQYIC